MTVSIKMTASQKAKLAKLGGAEWVRRMIDMAKPSKDQPLDRSSDRNQEVRGK